MSDVKITSYDVPEWMKDRINSSTYEEIEAWRNSVKSPNECMAGDPDLQVWWACQSVLTNCLKPLIASIVVTDHQLAVMEWVLSGAYDEE